MRRIQTIISRWHQGVAFDTPWTACCKFHRQLCQIYHFFGLFSWSRNQLSVCINHAQHIGFRRHFFSTLSKFAFARKVMLSRLKNIHFTKAVASSNVTTSTKEAAVSSAVFTVFVDGFCAGDTKNVFLHCGHCILTKLTQTLHVVYEQFAHRTDTFLV